jgi:hypothetical protein
MSNLLDLAVAAHGGLERWNKFRTVTLELSVKPNGTPLVFNQHYIGTMDHWDPAVTDDFAREREVILFNNAGVSSTSGEVPTNCQEVPMQHHPACARSASDLAAPATGRIMATYPF